MPLLAHSFDTKSFASGQSIFGSRVDPKDLGSMLIAATETTKESMAITEERSRANRGGKIVTKQCDEHDVR